MSVGSSADGSFTEAVCSKAYVIGGVPIMFPCRAYPSQITMMDKIIKCLNKKFNCLLESPTGSGKSLALLCASLSWQKKVKKELEEIDAQLDYNLNAYGAAVDDLKQCPVHPKLRCEEELNCCQSNIPKIEVENITNSAQIAKSIDIDSLSFNEDVKINPDVVNYNPSTSFTCSAKAATKGVIFHDDEFEDFAPSKKYRNSSDFSNSPQFVKLGAKVLNRHSLGSKNNTRALVNQRLTDGLRAELMGTPKSDKDKTNLCTDESVPEVNQWCTCKSAKEKKFEKKLPTNTTLPEKLPTIYFGTRTHKQIEQIIKELKKTIYKDSKITILSSRERTCVHPVASRADNKNEACDDLLKAEGGPTCKFYKNSKMISHFQPNTLSTAFDLEDFVKICRKMKACPYFGARELLENADIVFCPYNYLVDPLIRSAMEINVKGSIIIMDEAHNIEDSARSAGSASFSQSSFEEGAMHLQTVGRQSKTIGACYLYFANIFRHLVEWLKKNIEMLTEYATFNSHSKVFSGDDMLAFLSFVKLGPDSFAEFRKTFDMIVAEEAESGNNREIQDMDKPKLFAPTMTVLKNLAQILNYMYKDSLVFIPDYRCVVMRTRRFGQRRAGANYFAGNDQYDVTLNFWCLNPAVAFSDIKDKIHSLIVASGTLSPMASFQSELGIPFQITLEANHVISKSQMWVGTIGRGPNNTCLNATYHIAGTFSFIDDLGDLVLHVCRIIPHGVLCFLPSYSMMDNLVNRWEQTGLWQKLSNQKVVLCEPRKNNDLSEVMSEFYSAIKDSENSTGNNLKGALFLAVCRGKVSEGLDFADNNARAVITVGIPFPSIKDAQVDLKKKYNDCFAPQRQIMTGSQWYEIQAFRAINQALGRCIRHRNDFGALIIVDERFQKIDRYPNGLSKWIRKEIEHFPSFSDAMTSLMQFADRTGLRNLED